MNACEELLNAFVSVRKRRQLQDLGVNYKVRDDH
jgi:hypothetical protein